MDTLASAYEQQADTLEDAGIDKGKLLGMQQGEATILMALLEEKFEPGSLEAHRNLV
ncbi:MAG: hypothetical protein K9L32_04480 [Chromatiaceae bacterium]|nr:hypothetical protein [Chromatiaceae bacterium]